MYIDDIQKLKEALSAEPYKNASDRYKPLSLLKEFIYSFFVALLPALVSLVYYISNHPDATGVEAGWWLLKSLVIATIFIFIIRICAPRKFLKTTAFIFLGAIFAYGFFLFISTAIICIRVGGTWGYYNSSMGAVVDINGNFVNQIGRDGSIFDNICFVSEEIIPVIRENKSFLYQMTTFVVK